MDRRPSGHSLWGLLALALFTVLVCIIMDNIKHERERLQLIEALTSAEVRAADPAHFPNMPTTITTDPKYDGLMRECRPAGYLHHKLGEIHASQFAFSQRLKDGSWQAEIPAVAGTELLLSVDWPNAAKPTETLEFLVLASPIIDGLPRYRLWYGGSSASQPAGTE